MAKGKRFGVIEDPRGVEWQEAADSAWAEAEKRARKSGRHPLDHYTGYVEREGKKETKVAGLAPSLPDFSEEASPVVKGEVLGRFVFQPDRGLVHDVTKALPACRVGDTPRQFIHFAHEVEANVPENAGPCPACMA